MVEFGTSENVALYAQKSAAPVIGMGATLLRYYIGQPCEVVEVVDETHVLMRRLCDNLCFVTCRDCDGKWHADDGALSPRPEVGVYIGRSLTIGIVSHRKELGGEYEL